MVWIINVSLTAMAVGWVNPQPENYTVYTTEDGETLGDKVFVTNLKDDPKLEEYKNNKDYLIVPKPGKLSVNVTNALHIVTMVCGALLGIATYYTEFWNLGDVDANNHELLGKKPNKKAPLITALLGYSPFILSYLALLVCKIFNIFPTFGKIFYFINYYAFYFIDLLIPNYDLAKDGLLNIILVGLILIPIPLICYAAYILGTKHIDIRRKIMYKKENNNG